MSTSALVSLEELVAVHQPKAKHCTSSEVPKTTTRTTTRCFLYTILRTSTSYELFDGHNTTTTGGPHHQNSLPYAHVHTARLNRQTPSDLFVWVKIHSLARFSQRLNDRFSILSN
ncbi:hypothetical protein TYRP_016217 [Tyrophagus putrescentiae]|nr:hypothetical protein TYRP_016217 [Tyrophagus putrescentiae]